MILKDKYTEMPAGYIWPFWLNLFLGNFFVALSAFPHLTFKKAEINESPEVDSILTCDPKNLFL